MKPKLGEFGRFEDVPTMYDSFDRRPFKFRSFKYMAPEIINDSYDDPFPCDVYRFAFFRLLLEVNI